MERAGESAFDWPKPPDALPGHSKTTLDPLTTPGFARGFSSPRNHSRGSGSICDTWGGGEGPRALLFASGPGRGIESPSIRSDILLCRAHRPAVDRLSKEGRTPESMHARSVVVRTIGSFFRRTPIWVRVLIARMVRTT